MRNVQKEIFTNKSNLNKQPFEQNPFKAFKKLIKLKKM